MYTHRPPNFNLGIKHTDNPYLRAGYPNRRAYLHSLASDYGVNYNAVILAAELMGEEEDFDGLVSWINEYSYILES